MIFQFTGKKDTAIVKIAWLCNKIRFGIFTIKYLELFLNLRLRLAQFDISGTLVGSKSAAVSMDARSAKADPSNLLRKVVVVRLKGKFSFQNSKIVV